MSSGDLDAVVMELNKTLKALVSEMKMLNELAAKWLGEEASEGANAQRVRRTARRTGSRRKA